MKEHRHAIIIIKYRDTYLQYFDKDWNSLLFLNCKVENNDIDYVKKYVENIFNVEVEIKYLKDLIHKKFSQKSKIEKLYHHYFYEVKLPDFINQDFNSDSIGYYWLTMEELENDKRVMEVNKDIIDYIKKIY